MLDSVFAREYDNITPAWAENYSKRRRRIRENPIILWQESYEKNPADFLDFIQDISNCLLLNGPSLYDEDNPNHAGLFDLAKGKINEKEYHEAEYAFGDKGTTPIRDNHFFFSAKNHSLSQIVSQPLRFQCKNIDNEYSTKKLQEHAAITKKVLKTMFAQSMAEEGVDLKFLEDQKIAGMGRMPNADAILDQLYGQEQLELIVYKLLQDISYRHNLQNLARKTYDNKLDVNAQFAYIKVLNNDVIPEAVHPDMVRWIAGRPIETLEDPSVSACSVLNYLTFNEVINKYQYKLNTGTGAKGLLKAIDDLKNNAKDFYYNPDRPYFSENYRVNTLTSNISDQDTYKFDAWGKVDYMRNTFYPYRKSAYGIGHSILEHPIFFKVQKPSRYIVEINGKSTTEAGYKKWRDEIDHNREYMAEFTELAPDEKRPKGQYVIDKYKEELWQAIQIGHCTLIDVKPYEYATTKPGSSNSYVGMPIVGQISREKSFVLLGANFNRWTNIAYQKIEEIQVQAGLSNAMMIDESIISDTDALNVLYNAKKTGILMFNSSKYSGGNAFSGKHFEMLKIGHHMEELEKWFAFVGMVNEAYNRLVGSGEAALGTASNYDSTQKTKLNIASQSQVKANNYWEHNQFMNQVLQRAADVAKKVYARDGYQNITLSTGEKELLKLTKDLNIGDYDIYLEAGDKLKDKKQIIDGAVVNVLSSGGIDMLEPLINILYAEDPNQALAILRQASGLIRQKEQLAAEQANQQALAMAQIQAQKIQVPVQVQQLRNEGGLAEIQAKNQEQRQREDFKGTMDDIKEVNDRDKKLLDSELRQDEATHNAALNIGAKPQTA